MPSPELILVMIGMVAGGVTTIFHVAMHVGKITNRVDRHDDRLDDQERTIEDVLRKLSIQQR